MPLVLGVLIVALLASIPMVGWIVGMLIVLLGLGGLWLLGREWWQGRKVQMVEEPATIG